MRLCGSAAEILWPQYVVNYKQISLPQMFVKYNCNNYCMDRNNDGSKILQNSLQIEF